MIGAQALTRIAACAAMLVVASPAWACPVCRSETGRQVRAGLFNSDFGGYFLMTLLPFLVFLAVVAWIHSGPPWPGETPMRGAPSDEGAWRRDRAHRSEERSWRTP